MSESNEKIEIGNGPARATATSTDRSTEEITELLTTAISREQFETWYHSKQAVENIRNGTAYFNGPSPIKPEEKHSPSDLIQCHRKVAYKQLNAPVEDRDPNGIFWIGSKFEEEVAVPFLQDVVEDLECYVTNSLWVDFTETTEVGPLQFKGETDPAIVDADGKPYILSEIKTRRSVSNLNSPSRHHRAQAHAYMKGLSDKHDRRVTDAIIIYGGRTNLEIRAFHIEFDPWFWRKTVVEWAKNHTEFRLNDELPPAEPEYGWECKFCSYRERCGKGETDHEDLGARGFLPGVTMYPKQKVVEYLEAHDGAILTPALAQEYPEIAAQYPVAEWHCVSCDSLFAWDNPDWDGNSSTPPVCPECSTNGTPRPLRSQQLEERDLCQGGDQDG